MRCFVFCLCLLFLPAGFGCSKPRESEPNKQHRDFGAEAYRAGVPANANPYVGSPHWTIASQAWLEGWMEESKKAAKKD